MNIEVRQHTHKANFLFSFFYSSDPPEDVTLYGPLTVAPGQVFSVICITSPANPPAEINWMIQGMMILLKIFTSVVYFFVDVSNLYQHSVKHI